jgi:glycosyltransferase involved in cell wall biosynthesis
MSTANPRPPLVSILTPVFNGQAYLRPCIESVLRQTYQNWEYVIVDNCSTDATPGIIREYAALDPRIRVVTNQSFVGIIENHNLALSQMSPQAAYCKVVQADDWIYPRCVEKFVQLCEENPTVSLATAYRLDGDKVGLKGLPESQSVFSNAEIARRFFYDEGRDIFGSPTSYFLRAQPIRDHAPFFNPRNIYADVEACLNMLRYGDFGFIHEVLTFTRRPPDSQTPKSHYLRVTFSSYLWIMKNHGAFFFSDEEMTRLVRRHLRRYYQVMARDLLLLRRNRDYWRHHLTSLRETGHAFSPVRLLAAMAQLPVEKWRNRKDTKEEKLSLPRV